MEEIRAICETELNDIPQAYMLVDKLPLTLNGKVDYRTLEEMAESRKNNAEKNT